jgi:Homocysteine/selenocysteine methylase (S-methylmethionine-dependent)
MKDTCNPLAQIHVIDGGLATELEHLGANLDGPLWSAQVLEDEPAKVVATHRAYVEAGSQCIATCSYQVSRMGYVEVGLSEEHADTAILRSVELAREAVKVSGKDALVACSLGPYGAALHNGGEYHGNYDCSFADLVQFHRERIQVIAGAKGDQIPDLLAFETFPSSEEALAIGEAMAPWPEMRAWFSFSCRDDKHISHGEAVRECAAEVARIPQTVGIGVNCVPSKWIPSLIKELRAGSDKPIMVYPNSGEGWDAEGHCWMGMSDPAEFGKLASEWFAQGVQIVGGCCRIGPEHIRAVGEAAGKVFG